MATTYNVYRDGVKIKSGLTTTTFTDTGLTAGKEYAYQVSSVNEVGESSLSEKVFVAIRSLTLDINGTTKTGAFADKTLDEDAYDDLAKKDSNTVYKVYPEDGNPDEAAWFLGEQPIDSAKEGDTVVYGRNLVADIINGYGLKVSGEIINGILATNQLITYQIKESEFTSCSFLRKPALLRYGFLKGALSVGKIASDVVAYDTIELKYEGIKTPVGVDRIVIYTYDMKENRMKVEKSKTCTPYTVAPEDVAMIPETAGGGAA